MKKYILFLMLAITSFFIANSQSITQDYFLLTINGIVNKTDHSKNYVVIDIEGKTQAELYDMVSVMLNRIFKFPNKTISRIENKSIQVSGTAPNQIYYDKNLIGQKMFADITSTFNFEFRDGKIKFSVLDFEVEGNPSSLTNLTYRIVLTGSWPTVHYVFTKKGKINMEKTKNDIELYFNNYIALIVQNKNEEETEW